MRLTFLGTKAKIEVRSRLHRRNSSLLVRYGGGRVLIDWGEDWAGRMGSIPGGVPDAIVVTHAHPDHAFGLRNGAPCPVWATDAAWRGMEGFAIEDRRVLTARTPERIGGLRVEAFEVVHSLNAPAVGLRIGPVSGGPARLFYVPDVVSIVEESDALPGIRLYVGDGSSITRSLVRRRGDQLFGHTSIRAQLGWCARNGVPRALFTHCGTQIVGGDERSLGPMVMRLGRERGVDAALARDGMEVGVD